MSRDDDYLSPRLNYADAPSATAAATEQAQHWHPQSKDTEDFSRSWSGSTGRGGHRAAAYYNDRRGAGSGGSSSYPNKLGSVPLYGYKTKICPAYMRGSCRNASTCTYAHGDAELRKPPDLRKTKLCVVYMETGSCPQVNQCTYAHGLAELQKPTGQQMPRTANRARGSNNVGRNSNQPTSNRRPRQGSGNNWKAVNRFYDNRMTDMYSNDRRRGMDSSKWGSETKNGPSQVDVVPRPPPPPPSVPTPGGKEDQPSSSVDNSCRLDNDATARTNSPIPNRHLLENAEKAAAEGVLASPQSLVLTSVPMVPETPVVADSRFYPMEFATAPTVVGRPLTIEELSVLRTSDEGNDEEGGSPSSAVNETIACGIPCGLVDGSSVVWSRPIGLEYPCTSSPVHSSSGTPMSGYYPMYFAATPPAFAAAYPFMAARAAAAQQQSPADPTMRSPFAYPMPFMVFPEMSPPGAGITQQQAAAFTNPFPFPFDPAVAANSGYVDNRLPLFSPSMSNAAMALFKSCHMPYSQTAAAGGVVCTTVPPGEDVTHMRNVGKSCTPTTEIGSPTATAAVDE